MNGWIHSRIVAKHVYFSASSLEKKEKKEKKGGKEGKHKGVVQPPSSLTPDADKGVPCEKCVSACPSY